MTPADTRPDPAPPTVVALADRGLLVHGVDGPRLAERVRRLALPGVEAVATTDSLVVVVDPDTGDPTLAAARVSALLGLPREPIRPPGPVAGRTATPRLGTAPTEAPAAAGATGPTEASAASVGGDPVEVPVRFDGADLEEVARRVELTTAEVADLLLGPTLSVAFLGFAPGFAYLTGLPDVLAALPRRRAPRARVAPGSVAVAGGYAAVYPQASPGGWNLLGSTDLPLFDRHRPPYAVLQPGQAVRFVAASAASRAASASDGPRPPLTAPGGAALSVEAPGLLTTVQDGGRRGVAHLGVPRAGAADPFALRLANRLVGNPDDAAALEVTVTGPCLRMHTAAFVAVVGDVPVSLDDRPVPVGAPVPVARGQELRVGTCRAGARAVVAVSGGVLAPEEVGSRSSDLLCRLGPGPLRAGDGLALGTPGAPAGHLSMALLAQGPLAAWAALVGLAPAALPGTPVTVSVVPGPDGTTEHVAALTDVDWAVQPTSDRVGVRLAPAPPASPRPPARRGRPLRRQPGAPPAVPDLPRQAGPPAMPDLPPLPGSRGAVTGMVQLPPGGEPVVLLCDHATVGGYPVVATVAVVDVALLAQCRPGRRVRLVPTDPDTARRRWIEAMAHLAVVIAGRYPTGAGS